MVLTKFSCGGFCEPCVPWVSRRRVRHMTTPKSNALATQSASERATQALVERFNLAQDDKQRAAIAASWLRQLAPRTILALRAACADSMSTLAIAEHLGVPEAMVVCAVAERGWYGVGASRTAEQRAKDASLLETWRETVSNRAQDLALGALDVTRDAITSGDAKGLANAARAAATLVGMARQAEGMDKRDTGAGSESLSISVFYIPSPSDRLAEAKRVSEAEDRERSVLELEAGKEPVNEAAELF